MKPTSLRPGDRVRLVGRDLELTFIQRLPRESGRQAVNVFRVEEAARVSPDDDGIRTCTDHHVSRNYARIGAIA